MNPYPQADIAVIGGTGFYSFLDEAEEVTVTTPYGDPSDRVVIGSVQGRPVAFLPRHGRDHRFPPHRINYRANLWALRAVGVGQVIGPCAVGSLRPELGPGAVVVPDQLVDRTAGRIQTYFDEDAVHVTFADPYCPSGRSAVLKAAAEGAFPVVDGGTMVVIEGPRFSTRAESQWCARQGWSLVNMTGHPEAVLAREIGLCYTSVALVTDLDAGIDADSAVAHEDVLRVFAENVGKLRDLLRLVVTALPDVRTCACPRAHDRVDLLHTPPTGA
ncbi:S-methyl-5'-thioadenosine phosphorylase [Streptomyces sp. 8N616]|uniref:S-methyl-5'-thioadenosine phosphorylase n=1 Tax=Streptomyces sp. 8N616 TaxID=3457414 RepID=UPI003FD30D5F